MATLFKVLTQSLRSLEKKKIWTQMNVEIKSLSVRPAKVQHSFPSLNTWFRINIDTRSSQHHFLIWVYGTLNVQLH